MKHLLYFYFFPVLIFQACQPTQPVTDKEQLIKEIEALETQLLQNPDASKNRGVALQLVEKSSRYAKELPQDSLTPTLLFKAADVARGAGEFGKAVQLWGEIWRNHENHHQAPMALFLQGFTFDSNLRDPNMAKKYYNQFLQKFPNDPLAEQVKQLLAVVDEKPEDLVKKFQQEK